MNYEEAKQVTNAIFDSRINKLINAIPIRESINRCGLEEQEIRVILTHHLDINLFDRTINYDDYLDINEIIFRNFIEQFHNNELPHQAIREINDQRRDFLRELLFIHIDEDDIIAATTTSPQLIIDQLFNEVINRTNAEEDTAQAEEEIPLLQSVTLYQDDSSVLEQNFTDLLIGDGRATPTMIEFFSYY